MIQLYHMMNKDNQEIIPGVSTEFIINVILGESKYQAERTFDLEAQRAFRDIVKHSESAIIANKLNNYNKMNTKNTKHIKDNIKVLNFTNEFEKEPILLSELSFGYGAFTGTIGSFTSLFMLVPGLVFCIADPMTCWKVDSVTYVKNPVPVTIRVEIETDEFIL